MKLPTPPISYRLDINGLRAYAVMAVLLFHFKLPGFSAGFIGVDVFFVISGFLMTAIIVKGLERNNFSIWSFYMARVRRIVPALLVLIGVLLVLGWFFLPTPDYQALGSQSAYSVTFISNLHFWRSAGYFDAAAHEKWLLHTWTLGVEAQFYLLLPIYLLALWKLRAKVSTLFWGLGFAFLASLVLSVVASSWKPVAAFYLLPTRGWEFVGGGLVFLLGRERPNLQRYSKAMFAAGFALWLVAMLVIDSQLAWPSAWALLPVLGTMLIILAQHSGSILTAHPVAQWLGDRSYSLYLWHWPFMVVLYFAGLQDDWLWIAVGLALSLLFGHLSYRWIETPTRISLTATSMHKQVITLGLAGMLIGVAAVSARLFVFEGRLAPEIKIAAAEVNNKDPRKTECHEYRAGKGSPSCKYGAGELGLIVVGDSHAQSSITGVEKAGQPLGKAALLHSLSGCRQVLGTARIDKKGELNICQEFNGWVLEDIKKMPATSVIIINRTTAEVFGPNEDPSKLGTPFVFFKTIYKDSYNEAFLSEYKKGLISTACKFRENNRPVYLVRPYPEMGVHVPNTLVRNMQFFRNKNDIKITLEEYHQRHAFVWQAQDRAAEQCGVKILDPLPYLCDEQYCYGSRDGRPLYYDDDHLSEYGNKFLVPMFEQVFRDQQ